MMVPCSKTVSLSSLWGNTMVPFKKTSSCKCQQKQLNLKASLLGCCIATPAAVRRARWHVIDINDCMHTYYIHMQCF